MTVCIVDTTVLLDLLNVPGLALDHDIRVDEFATRQHARESFLLPLAVLVETGNHVAQVNQGEQRRKAAADFVEFATTALGGDSPFVPTPLPTSQDIAAWLVDFPEYAMRGVGLGDRSLIAVWAKQHKVQPKRRVYTWSRDEHLSGYDTG